MAASSGGTGKYRLQPPSRLEFATEWLVWTEQVDGKLDSLTYGKVGVDFRFAQSEGAQFRTGIASRHLIDGGKATHGFEISYGLDLFVTEPVIVSGEAGFGRLGGAWIGRARLTAGAVFGHALEVQAGWDAQSFGGTSLHGPVLGVRLWL